MAATTLIKNFGASEYILNKYGAKGQVGTMLGEMVMPPLNVVDGMVGLFTDTENMDRHMKHMPLFGKMWYYYMGDGIERLHQRRQQEKELKFAV